jgi:hypothetical protein
MSRDYLFRSHIHGLDLEEKRIAEPRITVRRGDQSDDVFMRTLGRDYGAFNVIIDDGKSFQCHVRASFAALFDNHLRPGGLYVIEGLATAYDPAYGGGPPRQPDTFVSLIKRLLDELNLGRRVAAVAAYEHIAFIEKAC